MVTEIQVLFIIDSRGEIREAERTKLKPMQPEDWQRTQGGGVRVVV